MLRAIIVDDENNALEALKTLLTSYCPQVKIIETATSVEEAYQKVVTFNPNLLFLDVEMTNGTGFDLLMRFDEPSFKVIFVTGFDQYALNAIKFSAIDYLLKPIHVAELIEAVKKAEKQLDSQDNLGELRNLLSTLNNPRNRKNKIAIPTHKGFEMIEVQDIVRCEASSGYTLIHLLQGKPVMSSRDLKTYHELLEEYDFFRIHDSHLISHFHIQKVLNEDGGVVVLTNDIRLPIARRRKSDFLEWLRGR
ncbi:MAG: LytR/AlgR family response regulator transcription factor [Flectobacillus sp.]|uniref:LytR/AlgR family response regulator transcription factor n=1 Tax=Flectobacillus sp. TaxID=50419 RepID=UPI003B995444